MADAVEVRPLRSGVRLRLRVKPGARRDRLIGALGGALKLEVRAAPEGGKANAAVSALLARSVDVPASAVSIVAGAGSRDKVAEIAGLEAAVVVGRLAAAGIAAVSGERQGS